MIVDEVVITEGRLIWILSDKIIPWLRKTLHRSGSIDARHIIHCKQLIVIFASGIYTSYCRHLQVRYQREKERLTLDPP